MHIEGTVLEEGSMHDMKFSDIGGKVHKKQAVCTSCSGQMLLAILFIHCNLLNHTQQGIFSGV